MESQPTESSGSKKSASYRTGHKRKPNLDKGAAMKPTQATDEAQPAAKESKPAAAGGRRQNRKKKQPSPQLTYNLQDMHQMSMDKISKFNDDEAPPQGCVTESLGEHLPSQIVHKDMPPFNAKRFDDELQKLFAQMKNDYLGAIEAMRRPGYEKGLKEQIEREQERRDELKRKAEQLEKQIQVLIEDSTTMLKSRLHDLGITATTPPDFIEEAKNIVCCHNDLTRKKGSLEAEIKELETEQERLVREKEKELLDKVLKDNKGHCRERQELKQMVIMEIQSCLDGVERPRKLQKLSGDVTLTKVGTTDKQEKSVESKSSSESPKAAKESVALPTMEVRLPWEGSLSIRKVENVQPPPPSATRNGEKSKCEVQTSSSDHRQARGSLGSSAYEERVKMIITSVLAEDVQAGKNEVYKTGPLADTVYHSTQQRKSVRRDEKCVSEPPGVDLSKQPGGGKEADKGGEVGGQKKAQEPFCPLPNYMGCNRSGETHGRSRSYDQLNEARKFGQAYSSSEQGGYRGPPRDHPEMAQVGMDPGKLAHRPIYPPPSKAHAGVAPDVVRRELYHLADTRTVAEVINSKIEQNMLAQQQHPRLTSVNDPSMSIPFPRPQQMPPDLLISMGVDKAGGSQATKMARMSQIIEDSVYGPKGELAERQQPARQSPMKPMTGAYMEGLACPRVVRSPDQAVYQAKVRPDDNIGAVFPPMEGLAARCEEQSANIERLAELQQSSGRSSAGSKSSLHTPDLPLPPPTAAGQEPPYHETRKRPASPAKKQESGEEQGKGEEAKRWQDEISTGFDKLVALASEVDKRRRSTDATAALATAEVEAATAPPEGGSDDPQVPGKNLPEHHFKKKYFSQEYQKQQQENMKQRQNDKQVERQTEEAGPSTAQGSSSAAAGYPPHHSHMQQQQQQHVPFPGKDPQSVQYFRVKDDKPAAYPPAAAYRPPQGGYPPYGFPAHRPQQQAPYDVRGKGFPARLGYPPPPPRGPAASYHSAQLMHPMAYVQHVMYGPRQPHHK